MNYENLIENEIEERFDNQPLFWSVEPDLQFWLAHKIHQELDKKTVPVKVPDFEDKGSYSVEYKDFLDKQIKEQSEKCGDSRRIKRVITEVTFTGEEDNSDRRKFDIGVMENGEAEIILVNGTKNYIPDNFETLIELKFVKNDHYYKLFSGKNGKTSYNGMKDFRDQMKRENEKYIRKKVREVFSYHKESINSDDGWEDDYNLLKDIYKLQRFDVENKFVILLSNYDILYETGDKSREEMTEYQKHKEKINRIIGEEIEKFIEDKTTKRIEFLYFTPQLA